MEKDLKDRHHTRRLEIPLGSQIQASGWDFGQHQCEDGGDQCACVQGQDQVTALRLNLIILSHKRLCLSVCV